MSFKVSSIGITALGVFIFTPLCINAQAVYGNLIGTVTDPTGAVVAGAKVTVKNVGQNVTTSTTTNDSCNYTVVQLPPGQYELTVEKSGFNRVTQQNVTVA